MIIIKIGGGEKINTEGIISDLASLNEKFIIVHGANFWRDDLLRKLNIEKQVVTSVSGYSSVFTDKESLDAMMMTYSGLRNKRIVELCQQNGINAVGLSGIDGKVIRGKRNSGIRTRENEKLKLLRDLSGKPKEINSGLLKLLLDNDYTPVLCVPIIDENNFAINSENDDIVALLQSEFKAGKIFQFIEAEGFLSDKNDPGAVIKSIESGELESMEEKVEGRMKRKILALRKLYEKSSPEVHICDGRTANPLKDAINGKGTIIK